MLNVPYNIRERMLRAFIVNSIEVLSTEIKSSVYKFSFLFLQFPVQAISTQLCVL